MRDLLFREDRIKPFLIEVVKYYFMPISSQLPRGRLGDSPIETLYIGMRDNYQHLH
jgi:hypothetical protein